MESPPPKVHAFLDVSATPFSVYMVSFSEKQKFAGLDNTGFFVSRADLLQFTSATQRAPHR